MPLADEELLRWGDSMFAGGAAPSPRATAAPMRDPRDDELLAWGDRMFGDQAPGQEGRTPGWDAYWAEAAARGFRPTPGAGESVAETAQKFPALAGAAQAAGGLIAGLGPIPGQIGEDFQGQAASALAGGAAAVARMQPPPAVEPKKPTIEQGYYAQEQLRAMQSRKDPYDEEEYLIEHPAAKREMAELLQMALTSDALPDEKLIDWALEALGQETLAKRRKKETERLDFLTEKARRYAPLAGAEVAPHHYQRARDSVRKEYEEKFGEGSWSPSVQGEWDGWLRAYAEGTAETQKGDIRVAITRAALMSPVLNTLLGGKEGPRALLKGPEGFAKPSEAIQAEETFKKRRNRFVQAAMDVAKHMPAPTLWEDARQQIGEQMAAYSPATAIAGAIDRGAGGLTVQDEAARREVGAVVSETVRSKMPWLERWVSTNIGQAAGMGTAMATGAVSRVGVFLNVLPGAIDRSYVQLRGENVDDVTAGVGSILSGMAEAAIESYVPVPLLPEVKGLLGKTIGQTARRAAYAGLKNYAGEWGEEIAQGITTGILHAAARSVSVTPAEGDKHWLRQALQGAAEGIEAGPSFVLSMVPGAMHGVFQAVAAHRAIDKWAADAGVDPASVRKFHNWLSTPEGKTFMAGALKEGALPPSRKNLKGAPATNQAQRQALQDTLRQEIAAMQVQVDELNQGWQEHLQAIGQAQAEVDASHEARMQELGGWQSGEQRPIDELPVYQPPKTPSAPPGGSPAPAPPHAGRKFSSPDLQLVFNLSEQLDRGEGIGQDLWKHADSAYGGTRAEGKYGPSEAYDALEAAVNVHLFEKTDPRADIGGAIQEIRRLEGFQSSRLPSQQNRSGEKEQFQQFSTPPAYAYAVAWIANLTANDVALEPSAGTGDLALQAKNAGARVYANELSERRARLLRTLGLEGVFITDAEHVDKIMPGKMPRPTAILMNPPFSRAAHRMGKKKIVGTDRNHVNAALKLLAPGGRLVAIMGAPLHGGETQGMRDWLKHLRTQYNVRANVQVARDVYKGYGTDFPTRVLVVDKPLEGAPTAQETVAQPAGSLEELVQILEGVRNDRGRVEPEPVGPIVPEPAGEGAGPAESETPPLPEPGDVGAGGEPGENAPSAAGEPVGGPGGPGRRRKGKKPKGGGETGAAPGGRDRIEGGEEGVGGRPEGAEPAGGGLPAGGEPAPEPSGLERAEGGIDPTSMSEEELAAWILAQAQKQAQSDKPPPGVVPEELPPEPTPPPGAGPPTLKDKAAQARQELDDAYKELGAYLTGLTHVNPSLDPKLLGLAAKLTAKAIKAGFYTFADFINDAAQKLGPDVVAKISDALEWAWETVRAADNTGKVGPTGKVRDALEGARQDNRPKKPLGDSLFEDYQPEKLHPAAKPHRGTLVESAAMSAVKAPAITYRPNLPLEALESGAISDAQLVAIAMMGQVHEQPFLEPDHGPACRRGGLIGDGTGVGKTRELLGVAMDNWRRGRKKVVFLTKGADDLLPQVARDWKAIGGDPADVFQAKDAQKAIAAEQGILVMSYSTLRSKPKTKGAKTRLEQVQNWVGRNWDGVLIYDESHEMANALDELDGNKKSSQAAKVGRDLARSLPAARVVYASATAATEVENLAYCDRLGLWGPGTEFDNVREFVNELGKGGIAAMEGAAQSMKAQGIYISRGISFNDGTPEGTVQTDPLHSPLRPHQRTMYDTLARAWNVIIDAFEAASAKTHDRWDEGQFWTTHQRFFNTVITSFKVPALIEAIEKDLAEGRSAVIQLIDTGESALNRALSVLPKGGDYSEVDRNPIQDVIGMVMQQFPVDQWEEYEDEEGNVKWRPVVEIIRDPKTGAPVLDENGEPKTKPVQDPEAVKARDQLVEQLRTLPAPEPAIDQIIQHFGHEAVAEVSGRKTRLVKEQGKWKLQENLTKRFRRAEVQAFQDKRKRILVFTAAGGTGLDYHAGKDFINQEQRSHYLLQGGWRASTALQGLGRTHRTNQRVAPIFRVVATDLPGERRFIATIARRLAQLGALTKGQRQAGTSIYKDSDNIESLEARAGLQRLYQDAFEHQIEGLEIADIEQILHMRLLDKDGNLLRDRSMDMTKFLNRVLGLPFEQQLWFFSLFVERWERAVDEARAANKLDRGVENIAAERVTKELERVVYTHPGSGATVKQVRLKLYNRVKPISYQDAVKTAADRLIGFYRKVRSGRIYAFVGSDLSKTDPVTGQVIPYVRRIGQRLVEPMPRSDLDESYDEVSRDAAKPLWDAGVAALPEFAETRVNLISGALLPIWKRIAGHPRIKRAILESGEQVLGRDLSQNEMRQTLSRLGIRGEVTGGAKMSVSELAVALNRGAAVVTLGNDWMIERVRRAGEWRLQVFNVVHTDEGRFTGMGGFKERFGSRYLYFIPTGLKTEEVLKRITKQYPVSKVQELEIEEEGEAEGDEGLSAYVPPEGGAAPRAGAVHHAARLRKVFDYYDQHGGGHGMVALADLRDEFPELTLKEFHAVVRAARVEGWLGLAQAESLQGLSERDRATAVVEDLGGAAPQLLTWAVRKADYSPAEEVQGYKNKPPAMERLLHKRKAAPLPEALQDVAETESEGDAAKLERFALQPTPTPELVELTEHLLGERPKVKKLRRWLGMFKSVEGGPAGLGQIVLNAITGRDWRTVARVLAHEIGHSIDWLPDYTIKRGNVLGRVASLRHYMADWIAGFPGGPPPLTAAERARLRRQAKKEVGPNATADEISAAYQKLLKDEAANRKLLSVETIHKELVRLSEWWSPYDKARAKPSYVAYRQSANELYAEALSVFLNSPGDLARWAPEFWRGFTSYLEEKPEVMAEYMHLQALLNGDSEELWNHRFARQHEAYGTAEEKILAAQAAREAAYRSSTQQVLQILQQHFLSRGAPVKRLAKAVDTETAAAAYYALDELSYADNALRKFLDSVQREVYKPLTDAGHTENEIGDYLFFGRIVGPRGEFINPGGHEVTTAIQGMTVLKERLGQERFDELGQTLLKWHDLVFEVCREAVGEGVYSQSLWKQQIVPNRHNYAAFAVVKYLEDNVHWQVKKQMGTFQQVANPFTATMMKMVSLIRQVELNKTKNRVRDFLLRSFPGECVKVRSESKHHLRPGYDYIRILENGRWVSYEVPEAYTKVFSSHDLGLMIRVARFIEGGVYRVFHPLLVTLNPSFWAGNPFRDLRRAWINLSAYSSKIAKEMRETLIRRGYDPALAKKAADRRRVTLGQVLWAFLKAIPAGHRRATGVKDEEIDQLLDERALSIPFVDLDYESSDETAVVRMMQKYNLISTKDAKSVRAYKTMAGRFLGGIVSVPSWLQTAANYVGVVQETATKVAASRLLAERGIVGQERAHVVRNYCGTPNFKERGLWTPLTNGLFMYSNVRWQGLAADLDLATAKDTAAAWWLRQVVGNIIPTLTVKAAQYGLFGYAVAAVLRAAGSDDDDAEKTQEWVKEHVEKPIEGASKYLAENYDVVPLGMASDGEGNLKAVVLTIPTDDTGQPIRRITSRLFDLAMKGAGVDQEHPRAGTAGEALGGMGEAVRTTFVPSLSPPFDLMMQWGLYAAGVNPREEFFNTTIVPESDWQAGGWYANRRMLAWTAKEFGVAGQVAQWFIPMGGEFETGESLTLERVLRGPTGIGKLLRITGRGFDEDKWAEIEAEENEQARFRKGLPAAARKLVKEFYEKTNRDLRELPEEDQIRRRVLVDWYERDYKPASHELQVFRGDSAKVASLSERLEAQSEEILNLDPDNVPRRYLAPAVYRITEPTGIDKDWLPDHAMLKRQDVAFEDLMLLLFEEQARKKEKRGGEKLQRLRRWWGKYRQAVGDQAR